MLLEVGAAVVAVGLAAGATWRKKARRPAPPADPRTERMLALRDQIKQAVEARDLGHLMGDQLAQVDRLVAAFGEVATEEQRCAAYVRANPSALVTREITALKDRLTRTQGPTRALLQENVEVLKRRREKLGELQAAHEALKARLEVMEDTFKLVLDQAHAASPDGLPEPDVQRLSRMIAAADEALTETRAILAAHH